MNRILVEPQELSGDGTVRLTGRRARHISAVLKPRIGQELKVGILGGAVGSGQVLTCSDTEVALAFAATGESVAQWVDLLLAVPRPKALKRLWPQFAALGVGRIILINATAVERCYFDTHWLAPASYRPLLIEGLEQSGTTQLPEVRICRAFKPFIEDELERLFPAGARLLAHPGAATRLPRLSGPRPLLAVGPEGGWNDYELGQLERHGFVRISLGSRTLRTDTACIALLGALSHAVVPGCVS